MKRLLVISCLFVSSMVFATAHVPLAFPQVNNAVFENGLTLYHIKDELPRTSVALAFGFGKLYETRETAGLSEIIEKTLLLGGTRSRPGNELNEYIESMGGTLSVQVSFEQTIITITLLSRYSELAVELLAEIAQEPLFSKEALELAKTMILDDMERRKDRPDTLGIDRVKHLLFDGIGYGALPSSNSLDGIDESYLKKFWREYIVGDNSIIAVATNRNVDYIKKLIDTNFSWMKRGNRQDYISTGQIAQDVIKKSAQTIYYIPRDIPQSTVVFATAAPEWNEESVYALDIMNYILGGGSFNSRLVTEVRVRRGLAYSVGSTVRSRLKAGLFLAYAQTGAETTVDVIGIMSETVTSMYARPVTPAEADWAKDYLINSYIFSFDDTSKVLGQYSSLHYYGLKQTYYRNYRKNIRATSIDDVTRIAQNLFSQGFIILVVGPESVKEELSSLWPVVRILP